MAISTTQKLVDAAQNGQVLLAKDRCKAIAFLMATNPSMSVQDMSELFKVSVRQIYLDKTALRKNRAKVLREEDPGLVLADIAMCFDKQVRDMEASKARSKPGSSTYLAHCKAIFNTMLEKTKALQDLGYYPKNLGNMVIEKYEWRAQVSKDGTVNTRPVNMKFDDKPEPEVVDVEFAEVAQLPPPEEEMPAV